MRARGLSKAQLRKVKSPPPGPRIKLKADEATVAARIDVCAGCKYGSKSRPSSYHFENTKYYTTSEAFGPVFTATNGRVLYKCNSMKQPLFSFAVMGSPHCPLGKWPA